MAKTFRRRSDDDAFDEDGLLKDGHSVRVPLMLKDALHDGFGGAPGRKPGFAFTRDLCFRSRAASPPLTSPTRHRWSMRGAAQSAKWPTNKPIWLSATPLRTTIAQSRVRWTRFTVCMTKHCTTPGRRRVESGRACQRAGSVPSGSPSARQC